jgi:hypothetical protein
MAEGLRIEIGADVKDLERALRRARQDLDRFEVQATKGGKALNKFNKAGVNATPVAQEFSRVIQDAPFGIQGVANNIQQLTANFGNLSKQAGGAIPALKAVGSSLLGPAGILFAVSTITSLLVTFGDELFSSTKKAEKLQEAIDGLVDGLDAELRLSKAIEKNLELQGQSTDSTLQARREIVREKLNELKVVNEQVKQELDLLAAENKRVDNIELLQGIFQKLFKLAKGLALIGIGNFADDLVKVSEKLFNIEVDRSKFAEANKESIAEEAKLRQQYTENVAKQVELENLILETRKKQTQQTLAQNAAVSSSLTSGLQAQGLTGFDPATISTSFNGILLEADLFKFQFLANLAELNEGINNLISADLQNTFQNLGNVIGQGLAQGANVAQAIGQGLLASLGQFISKMGGLLIKYGLLAKAKGKLDLAIAAGGPASIVAGAAAIALGVALKAAGAAIGNAAQGGLTGGVGGTGGGTFGGSNISLSGGGNGGGRVIFEIAGDKLIGVLNNSLNGNQSIGDAVGID